MKTKNLGCWLWICIYIYCMEETSTLFTTYQRHAHFPIFQGLTAMIPDLLSWSPPPPCKGLQTLPRVLLIKALYKNTFPQNFRSPHSPEGSRPATLSKVIPESVYSTFRKDSVFPYSLEYIFGVNCTFKMISCLCLFKEVDRLHTVHDDQVPPLLIECNWSWIHIAYNDPPAPHSPKRSRVSTLS
jgi:hypothetical protein